MTDLERPVNATPQEEMFGGCEGPDAMYVKLISSDAHEFIIKREHALTSGTIKAMLSGPGQFSENETNEVNFREIPAAGAKLHFRQVG
ncbi:TCEB1 [Cordylochernes scorpioides]|uniref:TCEB1 n=1 Tax=Cordylochernes scorpioides TaxID=51811 RepID=A0ABY6L4G2_9ARAC|nr:TCEB1 [Cordylochernes scorpioides]